MLSHLLFSDRRSGPAESDLMNMTLPWLAAYCTTRPHEQARSRVQRVLGRQSVVVVVRN